MSYTNIHRDFAKLVSFTYKDNRPRTITINKEVLKYRPDKSTGLWAWYENNEIIALGIHGADDLRLNTIAIGQFLDPERVEDETSNFCRVYKELIQSPKSVFIGAHSLGTWIVSGCEILNPNNKIEGVFFGSYVPNKESQKAKFMAETSRFKKIFYDNDWFANNLLKMSPLNNSIVLTPTINPFSFLNGHSLTLFLGDVSSINVDIKKVIPPIPEDKEKKLSTSLDIMNYNVKMLNPLIFDLRSNARAEWIPDMLNNKYPGNEVIIINELFDREADKIFTKKMRKYGYKSSQKVSENFLFHGKIEDGGVKIFSKYPIEHQEQTTYKDSSKEDALAGKGAISIRIRKNGIPIHIIGTHLQSGRKPHMIEDKKNQFNQLSEKLIDNQEILIVGGDMNIDGLSQSSLLNEVLENSGLKEFQGGGITTGTDFTGDGSNKKLDHFFYQPSNRFDITGQVEVIKDMRIEGGYNKPKDERKSVKGEVDEFGEDVEDKLTGLFKNKKKRKKRKKHRQKQRTRKVEHLSDHYPIRLRLNIIEK